MAWFVLASLTAFFEAVKDVFSKKSLKNRDVYVVAWSLSFFSGIFLIPFLFIYGVPAFNDKFLLALAIAGSLNTIALLLYIKAIKESDLSIALPMIALTPLFMVFTSPLIVGEWPNEGDFLGILLIVSGSYLLNIKESAKGYLAPFRMLLRETGPKLMLIVAFIWSIAANFDKIGIQNSSPIFWLFALFTFISICLLPILLYKSPNPFSQIVKGLPILVPMAIFNTLSVIFQMQALTLTLVVQVVAMKRTSVLIGVLFGHFIFKERGFQERLFGSVTMILGVLLMTLL